MFVVDFKFFPAVYASNNLSLSNDTPCVRIHYSATSSTFWVIESIVDNFDEQRLLLDMDKANSISIRRSSHRRCSVTKGVLRNFSKFVGKHLCQSLFFKKVAALRPATLLKRGTGTDQFLWILRISKNTFFHRTSLGGYFCLHLVLFWRKPLLRTMIFSVCFFSNLSVLFPILFVRLCWLYPLRFCELNIL